MNILFLSAEVAPYVSVGGLSQVMYFLPNALQKLGHNVRIFTANYGPMGKTAPGNTAWKLQQEIKSIHVPIENTEVLAPYLECGISSFEKGKHNPHTYFLENNEYFKMRENVFGYSDDHVRFALLSKGCLEWLVELNKKYKLKNKTATKDEWWPDIIHCNDWHTGYFVELARTDSRYKDILKKIPIIFTVHNFSYQGNYDFRYINKEEKDKGKVPLESLTSEKLQTQNALFRGILYADALNTVSPTHAVEVLTPEYDAGLGDILYAARGKLIGILNGLDNKEFNPSTDPIIKNNYNAKIFVKAREGNKKDLQKEFFLPEDTSCPLLAISGRLAQQKGFDILLPMLDHLLAQRPDVQVIVLGSGDNRYYERLMEIKKNFPKQIGLHMRADFRLPRKLFAGADIVLIPSIFEPGGIVALEALRYGAVPVVRRTGGLNDIITDFNPNTGKGNGFSFANKDEWSLYMAIVEALTTYKNTDLWRKLIVNCMLGDSSWEHSAKEYSEWYRKVIVERRRATGLTPHPAYAAIAEIAAIVPLSDKQPI
ncbi:MAG: glycogen synthase [Candidatus Levyibacteriota bacterium]